MAHIFTALGPDPVATGAMDPVQRSTYARMAQTCKALHEPANDALWSLLVSLEPLIKCLPSGLLENSDTIVSTIIFVQRVDTSL